MFLYGHIPCYSICRRAYQHSKPALRIALLTRPRLPPPLPYIHQAGGPRCGSPARDCRKSGFAAFSRKLRCVLRLGCPLIADNSTLTPRKVFSATHMSRQKTYHTAFASADAKLCEAFFDKLKPEGRVAALRLNSYFTFFFTPPGISRGGRQWRAFRPPPSLLFRR